MKKIASLPFAMMICFITFIAACGVDTPEPTVEETDALNTNLTEVVDTTGQAALAAAAAKPEKDSIAKVEAAKKNEEANQPKNPKPKSKPSRPKITFKNKTYNFGTVTEGDMVKHEFEFKNTGTTDLIIKNATASCGCTVPGFSFFPVEPGQEGVISVSFNSAHKVGHQRPQITVITNGYPSKHFLNLEGAVQSKPTPTSNETVTPEKGTGE
jgi:hypothetical protein